MTVIALERWTIYVILRAGNVSVDHRLMAESVISVNQVHGIILTVRGVRAMGIQIHVILILAYVLIAKDLLKEMIVIGIYFKIKLLLFQF